MSVITENGTGYTERDLVHNWAAEYAKRLYEGLEDEMISHVAELEGSDRDVLAKSKEYTDLSCAALEAKIGSGGSAGSSGSSGSSGMALADGSVTTAKLADGAVTAAKLADSVVNMYNNSMPSAAKKGDIAIITDTNDKVTKIMACTYSNGAGSTNWSEIYPSASEIPDDSITSAKLADGAVAEDTIGTGAVTETKLRDGSVTTAKLADAAVTNAKLADRAVDTYNLADGAVTAAKLCGESVTNDNIVTGAVDARAIADDSITLEKLAETLKERIIIGDKNTGSTAAHPDFVLESGIYQFLGGITIQVTADNTYKTTKNITPSAGILLVSDSDGDIIQILFCGERDTEGLMYAHPMQIYWRYLVMDPNTSDPVSWDPVPWMLVNPGGAVHGSSDTVFDSSSVNYDADTYSAKVIDDKLSSITSTGSGAAEITDGSVTAAKLDAGVLAAIRAGMYYAQCVTVGITGICTITLTGFDGTVSDGMALLVKFANNVSLNSYYPLSLCINSGASIQISASDSTASTTGTGSDVYFTAGEMVLFKAVTISGTQYWAIQQRGLNSGGSSSGSGVTYGASAPVSIDGNNNIMLNYDTETLGVKDSMLYAKAQTAEIADGTVTMAKLDAEVKTAISSGAAIDDSAASESTTYSSSKIENMFDDVGDVGRMGENVFRPVEISSLYIADEAVHELVNDATGQIHLYSVPIVAGSTYYIENAVYVIYASAPLSGWEEGDTLTTDEYTYFAAGVHSGTITVPVITDKSLKYKYIFVEPHDTGKEIIIREIKDTDVVAAVNRVIDDVADIKIYSTTPVKVGTWLDGTPIWRWAFDRAQDEDEKNDKSVLLIPPLINTSDAFVVNSFVRVYSDHKNVNTIDGGMAAYSGNSGWCWNYNYGVGLDYVYGWIEFATPESNIKTETEETE